VSTVAITIDGVLRKVKGETPIQAGIELYLALAQTWNVVLLSDYKSDDKVIQMFMNVNGLREQVKTIGIDSVEYWQPPPQLRVAQVNWARYLGQNVQLVVEPDPECSAALIDAGYNVCTFTAAEYSVPMWRPDFTPRFQADGVPQFATPWETLQESVAKQAEMKAKDGRLKE
jgi:hypothetical protein